MTVKAHPASGSTVAPGASIRYTLHAKSTSGPLPAGARVVDDLSGLLGYADIAAPRAELAKRGLKLNVSTRKLIWMVPAQAGLGGSSTAATASFRARVAADAPDGAKLTTAAEQRGESCRVDEPCATTLTVQGGRATRSPDPSPTRSQHPTPSHSRDPSHGRDPSHSGAPSHGRDPSHGRRSSAPAGTPRPDRPASPDPHPSSADPSSTSPDATPSPDPSPTTSPATPTVTATGSTPSSTPTTSSPARSSASSPPSAQHRAAAAAADPCDEPQNDPVLAGGFEIDGNLCTNTAGNSDWDTVGGQPVATDPYYPDDNSGFTGGQSENTGPNWTVGQSSGTVVAGQGRNDIGNVYASTRVVGEDVFAYFGFELRGGTGTMSLHAELNQKPNDDPSCPRGNRGIPSPCRTPGDLLLAFEKHGSADITLAQAWTWTGSAWVVLGNAGEVGRANNADITNLQGQTLTAGRFGEVAVDLTTLFGPATCSGSFGTLNLRTSASATLTSSLIDWVAPVHLGVPSTCPTVELQKHWVNGSAGDTAGLSIAGGAGALPGSATSTANGEPEFTDTANRAIAEAEPGSTVNLSETLPAPGHTNTGTYTPELPETCEISGDGTVEFTRVHDTSGTITVPDNLGAGDTITCTFTNRRTQAMLRLQKAWVNSVAGDEADLSISGPNAQTSDQATAVAPGGDGTSSEFAEAPIFSGETVDVREELPPGNTGAYTSEITCEPATGFTAGTGGRAGSIDVPANPTDTTCTFTNTRSTTGVLTLEKDWVNGASGDTAGLSATGSLDSGSTTATVPDHGATSIDKVVIAVTPGETVDLHEELPASGHTNTGSYTSMLECNEEGLHGVAPDGRSGSFDVTAAHENVTCTFTNTRRAGTVVLQKHWNNGAVGDRAHLSITGGVTSPATATSTVTQATGGTFTDAANQASTAVHTGETVTVQEDLPGSNTGSYDTSLSCDHGVEPGPDGSFRVTAELADTTVTCTFTNTRRAGTVVLQKHWNNGAVGDRAHLSITGGETSPATATSTVTEATGPTFTDSANAAATGVHTGETVTVAEDLPGTNTGSYDSSLSCDHGVTPGPDGSFRVTAELADTTVTCTFTNTRRAGTVVLQKHWNNGAVGDRAHLSITGGETSPATATSTVTEATGGTFTDTANQAATGVHTGETVTVAEDLPDTNTGSYDSSLSCDHGVTPGPDGSFTVTAELADTTVTCTFTNTRHAGTVVLQKHWNNGAVGDRAHLSITGGEQSPATATSTVTQATGPTFTDMVNQASTGVHTGETVTVAEDLPGTNTGSYDTSLSCDHGVEPGSDGSFTVTAALAGTTVTCTFTNTRHAGTVVLQKHWNNGAVGDQAHLSITGGEQSPATATSTVTQATGPTFTDMVNQASTAVHTGETVTVAEDLPGTNTGSYDTSLSCDHGVEPGSDGSFTVTAALAGTTVTCTFTNSRVSVRPSITTHLSASSITAGGSVHDSATLHGATSTAGGQVQYRFYDSLDACNADIGAFTGEFSVLGGHEVNTVNVADGVVPDSAGHTFTSAGTFFWAAFYSGDDINAAAAGGCASEELTVSPAAASISVEKEASVSSFTAAGQVITYTFRVTNSGEVPLHDVTVTDSRLGAVPCPATSLAPGASMTCTARYTTTTADVDRGSIANVGLATGTTPSGAKVRARSTMTLPFTGAPVKPAPPSPAPTAPIQKVPVQVTG